MGPEETAKLFPLLDPKAFYGSLWSPADGVIDPTMLCSALIKAATKHGGKLIESCPVTNILFNPHNAKRGSDREISGVETPFGTIKTKHIVNSCGAWSREIAQMFDLDIPLVPMKHAYVVTESMKHVKGCPNIRDHDSSIYFRIQGESICMGGYEKNPEVLKEVRMAFPVDLNV